MIHKRFVFRQLTRSGKQVGIFVLCVALSIVSLVAVNGFGDSINRSLLRDTRALHGGDIILTSPQPFSDPLKNAIATLARRGEVTSLRSCEFYSVVRSEKNEDSLLAQLKVVSPGYPFYGQVKLASGRKLWEVLRPGDIIPEQGLLDRLHLKVGDRLHVGSATLTIKDVVTYEPDRPVDFFSFGPRVLVHTEDLKRLDLLRTGSRATYTILLKVSDSAKRSSPANLATYLRGYADSGQERVETYRTAQSRIKRFFDNFLLFLALIGIFTLLLSGLGIRSSLTALLKEKEQTIAILRVLGGSSRFVIGNYIAVVALLGGAGTLLGLTAGFCLQYALPLLLGKFLPGSLRFAVSWQVVTEGAVLGVVCVTLFAFIPLYQLREVKPNAVFRRDPPGKRKGFPFYLVETAIFLFFSTMVLWHLEDRRIGIWFILGVLGVVLLSGLASQVILAGMRRVPVRSLALRQALRGLFRPGNATRAILITLSAALAVLFSIFLVEKNLDAAFVSAYPKDAPNLFFIDIQPDQVAAFSKTLGQSPRYYPIIRARLISINGRKIDPEKERHRRGDNLARPFNLTYRNDLLDDEALVAGDALFKKDITGLQVSVLDTVSKMHPMKIGDKLRFNIQGIPVEAAVSSIRTRTHESMQPFFYFVFPEDSMLRDAPQSIFTAIRVPKEDAGGIQNRIAAVFPNVTPINVTQAIAEVAAIVRRLTMVIRIFTAISIIAGVLIIISSIFATRLARTQETVYYKILGAGRRFVFTVFALENLAIGLISAFIALAMSQAGSWIVSVRLFRIDYHCYPGAGFVMVLVTILMVVGVGLSASIPILGQRPVVVLRQQTEE